MKRPLVWLVDDLKSNRSKFRRDHSRHFRVRAFHDTCDVLDALRSKCPDALLCDIYFFPEGEAKQIEQQVDTDAKKIRILGTKMDAEDRQEGIELAERIKEHYDGRPPFPIFAYTSKGPYLLETRGFNRVERAGLRWLFKRISPSMQRMIIFDGIAEHKKSTRKVFLVHGHKTELRRTVSGYLRKLGLVPIVLQEAPDESRTIIEKLEKYSDVEFAVILLTGDDRCDAGRRSADGHESRARQNVVLELGYFLGRLGRNRVCILYEKGVDMPSDVKGVLYKKLDLERAWQRSLRKELKHAGLSIDMKQVP